MEKGTADSLTVTTYKMSYQYLNRKGVLYGGKLLEWADEVATITAERHAAGHVTTALLDSFQFLAPVYLADLVTLRGSVTYVGKTSIEVCVDAFAEQPGEAWRPVGRGFVVMVAVDGAGVPVAAPPLICTTQEEKAAFAAGSARSEDRRKERAKQGEFN